MKMNVLKLGIMFLGLFVFSLSAMAQNDKPIKQKPSDEKRFAEMDTNKDGFVDLKEFKAYKPERVSNKKGDKPNKEKIAREEKVKKDVKTKKEKKQMTPEERFAQKDKNSDNKLDLQEFKSKPSKIKKNK